MSSSLVEIVKIVFMKSHTYRSSLLDVSNENVIESCNHLLQVTDKKDLSTSSRWFREMGDKKKRAILLAVGFREFLKEEGQIDSVVLANYIKTLVRNVQFGLIPANIENIILQLIGPKDEIEKRSPSSEEIDCVYALLSISKDRLDIIKSVMRVGKKILEESTAAPILPKSLASVLKVTCDELPPGLDQDQIKKRLMNWHETLAILLTRPDIYDRPVDGINDQETNTVLVSIVKMVPAVKLVPEKLILQVLLLCFNHFTNHMM